MDRVLVYGSARDPHVAAVRRELERRGRSVAVLAPRSYPAGRSLTFAIGPRTDPAWTSSGIDLDPVGVGWVATQRSVGFAGGLAPSARRFAKAQALQGLDSFLRGAPFPWVNDPDAATRADDKLHQLAEARRLGLLVPETLVTNDPKALRRFHREHGRLIAKSVSGSHGLPASKRILTNVVTKADLEHADGLRHAPVCFQEYVPKSSELRVTVIGDRAHAVRIHSQAQARTRDDWRRYGPGLEYSVARLPRAVERKCIGLSAELGLDYGGIDLVERPDGRHVFLEINTLPAWLWLEDATGRPITAAFADHLESRAAGAIGKKRKTG
jgi:hypothetical protein